MLTRTRIFQNKKHSFYDLNVVNKDEEQDNRPALRLFLGDQFIAVQSRIMEFENMTSLSYSLIVLCNNIIC